MQLFITDSERREAARVLEKAGLELDSKDEGRSLKDEKGADSASSFTLHPSPLILLNPGAQYGAAKCWLPEYFAQLADRFIEELGATVLISSAPKERPIVEAINRHMTHAAIDLARSGCTLGALKEIVRRCDLMVTNDTGPRHIAAAFDVPVVTIFGPTHPEWTEIFFEKERKISVPVFCGPCQKKTCPLDHRCMTRVTPAMVFDASMQLLQSRQDAAV
jgi:heptosyltransferase-2